MVIIIERKVGGKNEKNKEFINCIIFKFSIITNTKYL